MAPRRALAITKAIVDELVDLADNRRIVERFRTDQVRLSGDGSVEFDRDLTVRVDQADTSEPSTCAASVGLVLFELLMARAPISSADAFEPGITSALPPELSALIVRSVSDTAAQWPTLDNWVDSLTPNVGGAATPKPPERQRRDRRRAVVSVVLLVILAAITILVVTWAPGWWDNTGSDEGSLGTQSTLTRS